MQPHEKVKNYYNSTYIHTVGNDKRSCPFRGKIIIYVNFYKNTNSNILLCCYCLSISSLQHECLVHEFLPGPIKVVTEPLDCGVFCGILFDFLQVPERFFHTIHVTGYKFGYFCEILNVDRSDELCIRIIYFVL